MNGIELIAQERMEQVTKHGRSIENDIAFNNKEQLVYAAFELLYSANFPENIELEILVHEDDVIIPEGWNKEAFLNLTRKPRKEKLIIAGALISAELDRIHYSNI